MTVFVYVNASKQVATPSTLRTSPPPMQNGLRKTIPRASPSSTRYSKERGRLGWRPYFYADLGG